MERWWLDLRYAVRLLLRKPGFTIVAVLSLALGIGANTAIFTVVNAIFLHPLAVEEPSRLVELFTKDNKTVQSGNFALTPSSFQNYEDYRDQNQVFTGLAAYFGTGLQWTHDGEIEGLPGMMVSGNYFEVLGIRAFRGRVFGAGDDDKPGANTAAVISHTVWTKRFGAGSRHDRQGSHAERHRVHGDRCRATRLQGHGGARRAGPDLGAAQHARAARHGAVETADAEPALSLDQHGRAAEAGRRHAAGGDGDEDDRLGPREAVSRRQRWPDDRDRARVRRGARHQWTQSAGARRRRDDERRRRGAADRVREPREPAARAVGGAREGDQHPLGDGRRAGPPRGAAADRERAARGRRRRRRPARRRLGADRALVVPSTVPPERVDRSQLRSARAALHGRHLDPHRHRLRPDTRHPGVAREPERHAEGGRPLRQQYRRTGRAARWSCRRSASRPWR